MAVGAVLQGDSNAFVFRVLDHPADALDGRPRGAKEMLANLRLIGLRKEDVFVSDKWGGTVLAVKKLRAEKGWPRTKPPHEIVNHSEGEIVNAKGYSTNAIEAKWSVVKRWIRSKYAGRLPQHHSRDKLRNLLKEFQYRKTYGTQTRDFGHSYKVPVKSVPRSHRRALSASAAVYARLSRGA